MCQCAGVCPGWNRTRRYRGFTTQAWRRRIRSTIWPYRQQSGQGERVVSLVMYMEPIRKRRAECVSCRDSTQVSIATNLGDTKTIITHPATTSHGRRLTEAQRQAAGVAEVLIQVAGGLGLY
jgi:cystathionine beta-lyase/cystathionine gamma-synthase